MKKGALVEVVSGLSAPIPNIVIFQFNPETLRHSISHPQRPLAAGEHVGSNPLAVSGGPTESFSFSLALDVTDHLTVPSEAIRRIGEEVGIYPRLAALETFMHPVGSGSGGAGAGTPAGVLPTVLFVWNVGRILPVRVTSLAITEQLFDEKLNPTHAEANIELSVLTGDDLTPLQGATGALARAAYEYTQVKRVGLVATNLVFAGKSLIDMVLQDLAQVR